MANSLWKLLLQATAISLLADNAASTPATSLYLSLHTATPSGSAQTTSEAAYTSYARVAVLRSSSGFTVSTNTFNLQSLTSFPAATGGSETETHFALGTAASGTGVIILWGTVSPSIVVSTGVTPQLTTATLGTLGI